MKKFVRTLSVVVAAVFVLGACQPAAQPPAATPATPAPGATTPADTTATPPAAGQDTLTVVVAANPVTMDPVMQNDLPSAQIRSQIFEPLLRVHHETLEFVPALATSWEFEDAQTVHFELQQGVTFHNGDPFTSADVVFTFERALESTHTRGMFETIESVEATGPYSVTFHLNRPFVPILAQLAANQASIVNERVARELGLDGFHENPIGTGPFKFHDWIIGDRTILVRNDDWWYGDVAFEYLVFRVVPEQTVRYIEIETGNADIGMAILPTDVPRAIADPNVVLHRMPNLGYHYLGFNMLRGAFAGENGHLLRQAVAYALDMEAIIDVAFAGTGTVGNSPLTPQHHFHVAQPRPERDLDRVQELLEEAGVPDGFSFRFMTNTGNQARADVGEMVQNQLRQANIDMSLELIEWATFLEVTDNPPAEHDMFMLGWISGNPDPNTGLDMIFHSRNWGGPGNRSFLADDRVDYLIMAGQASIDPAERAAIYAEIQEIIIRDIVHIPVWHGEELNIARPEVQGFVPVAHGSPWFWEVYFAQ
ncbi:MAG: ABC transporter substrate-binding protein [Defluviitaleaceae bacterium]|nr:ABC transporter substrate-binding protein [Defluviitaleaceae bacterium]